MTQEDTQLLQCLASRVEQLRQGIRNGRPYVWELRLSLKEFGSLETAIENSISSHNDNHDHLLSEEFAVIVVMYLAEWYKRYYKAGDEQQVLKLTTEELKRLYDLAGIDKNTFVYNASKNPDKASYRWQESLQVLGGLAVQAELKRDQSDQLLSSLCKIFHGEEIDIDDFKDRNRAVAFQESIARQHSLYEYLKCILEKDERGQRNLPFAQSDIGNRETYIPQFICKIEKADRIAKKHKFDFEWIINYTASRNQMVRHLRVKLKPEEIGGGRKQYIGYDRLRLPEWGIEHPEEVGRIQFYLRFKNGVHYVQKEDETEEPLFKFVNTGSEKTGFLSVKQEDENTYMNVPVQRFNKVEIVMKYDNACHIVQELDVKDYMQVYGVSKNPRKFTDRRNSQAATIVIFSSAYHLAEDYKDLPVEYAHYRNGEEMSEDYCWCPINDKVVIADSDEHEVTPPFFNRNGLYQVVTKKYLKTIKYHENLYVLYQYIDPDDIDPDDDSADDEGKYQDDPQMTVLFGRTGLEVRHFLTRQATESEAVTDYDLEWLKDGRYINWNEEEPKQGVIRLRVTVKGIEFKAKVYYVPFAPGDTNQSPIWRDFEHMRICTALDGVDDIQDDINMLRKGMAPEDTKQLKIGTDADRILVDVYRPIIVRELSQKKSEEAKSKVIKYYQQDEDIHIPLINCEQFSVRDFSEDGVKEYQVKKCSTVYYNFPTFNRPNLNKDLYTKEHSAKELMPEVPLDYLKIYITRAQDERSELYAWDYVGKPIHVQGPDELAGERIVFQSLKEQDSPRHYSMPTIRNRWGGNVAVINPLFCFETVAEHKTYFFLFKPLIEVIADQRQIQEIFLPLMKKREYQLTKDDIDNLYRFAVQFHFDWMLLPRETWKNAIEGADNTDEEREKLKEQIMEFFKKTPKCNDKNEYIHLSEFLEQYWTFNRYPDEIDDVPKNAVRLILNEPNVLGRQEMREFLKRYDDCRFKFIEMNKVITTVN